MPIRRRNPVTGESMLVPTLKETQQLNRNDPKHFRRPQAGNPLVKLGKLDSHYTFQTREDAMNYIRKNPQFVETELWYLEQNDGGDWETFIAEDYEEIMAA